MLEQNPPFVLCVGSPESKLARDLQEVITKPVQIRFVGSLEEVKTVLVEESGVAAVICGLSDKLLDPVSFFQFIQFGHPHIQCILVCGEGSVDAVVDVKNAVTSMSVVSLPLKSSGIEVLIHGMVAKAGLIRANEKLMRKSLVDEQRRTRDTRLAMCYQIFGFGHIGRVDFNLASFFHAAFSVQSSEALCDLKNFDMWQLSQSEAYRMRAIAAHVREWKKRFGEGISAVEQVATFARSDSGLCVVNMAEQLAIINGPSTAIPTLDECCLLGYLLWCETPKELVQTDAGRTWTLVDRSDTSTLPDDWMREVISRCSNS